MTWLLPGTDTAVVERHFCRGCAPTGRVADVVCVRCGDGPLLTGVLRRNRARRRRARR